MRSPRVVVDEETGALCFRRDFALVVLNFRAAASWPLTARRLKPTFFSSTLILMILKSCSRPVSSLDGRRPRRLPRRCGKDLPLPRQSQRMRRTAPSAAPCREPHRHAMSQRSSPKRRLELLDASERRRFCGSTREHAFTFSPFFTTSEGCLTRLVQLRLNVHQPIDAVFDFNEGAKVGEVAHPAFTTVPADTLVRFSRGCRATASCPARCGGLPD